MSELIINNHIIDAPIIDIVNKIKEELTNGKLAYVKQRGDEVRVTCPNSNHKDGMESRPSCGIYCGDDPEKEYGTFNCFTCGAGGPLWHFVAECFDESDEFGKEWLLERFGNVFVERTITLPDIDLSKPKKEYIDESILDKFQSYHPYMDVRKLSRKVCETFKIKYDTETQCLVFPVWDEHNKLYLLTRRSVKDKTFIIDADKEKPVYLINYIKNKNIKEATLVESQINCLTLWGWGIPSIATFGCKVTQKQLDIINKSGIKHLYICYDGDTAGINGTKTVIKGLNSNIFVDVIEMIPGKDVNDISEETFNNLKIIEGQEWLMTHGGK